MQKANRPRDKWRNVVFFLTALLVVTADQLSKRWIGSYPEGKPIFEMGFFQLTCVHNTGAAFGLFQGQSSLLTIVGSVSVVLLLLYTLFIYRQFPNLDNKLGWSVLGLILGGTVGNLIDRLRFGYVIDFIDVGIWPAFNIADSSIVVGIILLAYSILHLAKIKGS